MALGGRGGGEEEGRRGGEGDEPGPGGGGMKGKKGGIEHGRSREEEGEEVFGPLNKNEKEEKRRKIKAEIQKF